jgi:hypothetical protein
VAVLANFAADYKNGDHEKDRDFTRQAIQLLLDARTEKDEQVWWSADETGVYATGTSAKYPIRVRTFKSRFYEYYDPEVSSVARPVHWRCASASGFLLDLSRAVDPERIL